MCVCVFVLLTGKDVVEICGKLVFALCEITMYCLVDRTNIIQALDEI